MGLSLQQIIEEYKDLLIDQIVKDAIWQIPAYRKSSVLLTISRVKKWLDVVSSSITQNDPDILTKYLRSITKQRCKEGR